MANGIRILTVNGSPRGGSFTSRALALVNDELRRRDVDYETLDPVELDLPFPGRPSRGSGPETLKKAFENATGVVLATPEYHGSFSALMKLTIENLGFPSPLSGKPVALLGVAAGQIGAIKSLEQLRSVCSHVGALVLPGGVSVARVQQVFDEEGRPLDEAIEQRIRGVATSLLDYIHGSICPRIALEQMVRS